MMNVHDLYFSLLLTIIAIVSQPFCYGGGCCVDVATKCAFWNCSPLSSFHSYGLAAGDSELPPTDDGSSPAITLPAPFRFYGASYTTIYVSQFIIQY